jgi:hypothetical protein
MDDRSQELRKEAARCLEGAARSTDPHFRGELIRLSQVFLAKSAPEDFDPVLQALTDMVKESSEPAVQQQRQIRPKKEDD